MITLIEVVQDNKTVNSDVLAVHSPIVMLIDVTYTGTVPSLLYCTIESEVYRCIPYKDLTADKRQFLFNCDEIFRSLMDSFNDVCTPNIETMELVDWAAKEFDLTFSDPENNAAPVSITLTGLHSTKQIGESVNVENIVLNENKTYLGFDSGSCYVYFWNDDANNKINIGASTVFVASETSGIATNFNMDGLDGFDVGNITSIAFIAAESGTVSRVTLNWLGSPNSADIYRIRNEFSNWIISIYDKPAAGTVIPFDTTLLGALSTTENINPFDAPLNQIENYKTHEITPFEVVAGNTYSMFVYAPIPQPYVVGGMRGRPALWNVGIGLGQNAASVALANSGLNTPGTTVFNSGIDRSRYIFKLEGDKFITMPRGLIRVKYDNLNIGTKEVKVYINNVLECTHSIIVKETCTDEKFIKYLDKDGQYRFFAFNKFYEGKDNPVLIGKSNPLLTNIQTAQSNNRIVGYRNEKILSVQKDLVTNEELLILSDLWTSPRVYLYIGDGTTDTDKDWILVEVQNSSNIYKQSNGCFNKVSLDLLLPNQYTITML